MVPVVSLMVLWGFVTVTTVGDVSDQTRLRGANTALLDDVRALVVALQEERSAATRYLADPSEAGLRTFTAKAGRSDHAAGSERLRSTEVDFDAPSPELRQRLARLVSQADHLATLRADIGKHKVAWFQAYGRYTSVVGDGLAVGGALRDGRAVKDPSGARVVNEMSRARELFAQQDALFGGARAAGEFTAEQYQTFLGAAHTRQVLLDAAVPDLPAADETAYERVLHDAHYKKVRSLENQVEKAGPGFLAVGELDTQGWTEAATPVAAALLGAEKQASTRVVGAASHLGLGMLGGTGALVVAGLVGVLLSLTISVRIGRQLVMELAELRTRALDVAGRRLPRAMSRLHAGEPVDIGAEVPEEYGAGEVAQVAVALNAVHRAALREAADRAVLKAAAERADELDSISAVYVNLARRSQTLLQRQLSLLDSMERGTEDPLELEALFRLDHLTTRMRRNAESLIILSGAAPARRWSKPVPVIDIVRSAVSEVEEYPRIELRAIPEIHVVGSAVADLAHLLAELLENALTFSPPSTRVRVCGERVGTGLVLEIEDHGLGMSREALAQANLKIEDPGRIDLLHTEQLGLFVVNHLSHQLNASVTLERSAYGGVTAVVLLPEELLFEQSMAWTEPAEPQGGVQPGPQTGQFGLSGRPTLSTPSVGPAPSPAYPGGTEAPTQPAGPARPAGSRRAPLPPGRPRSASRGGGPVPHDGGPDTPPMPGPPPHLLTTQGLYAQDAYGPSSPPLPRRVPQTNMAPQLRPQATGAQPAGAMPAPRSPEAAQATVAALRRGSLKGRHTGTQGGHRPLSAPAQSTAQPWETP
ncbi:nitrate- and nitrite sensing domain-containing protein [Streptomyces sp. NPDC005728]|uniref:sensor histidine kinase n=1 Tax=Streptomyces sp. NPDC005728 TaxID=3157054 RepID=UPI0033E92A5B